MYTQQTPTKATQQFINYMQSKQVQQTLVKQAHYVNIHDMQVQKNAAGKIQEKE